MKGTVAPSASRATTALTPERGSVSSAARSGTGSYGDVAGEVGSDGEAWTGSDDIGCAYAAGARASRLDLAEKSRLPPRRPGRKRRLGTMATTLVHRSRNVGK